MSQNNIPVKNTFHLRDNSLQYFGVFESPAFSLWKDRALLIENAFNLFSPFGIELADISTENNNGSVGDETLVVDLTGLCEFKLGYENISCESEDNSPKNLSEIFEVIAHINETLPSIATDLKYVNHLLEFGGHGGLDNGFSFRDVLQQFHEPKLNSVNQNLPSGIMLNWLEDDAQRRFHFELDESLNVPGGIFMRWVIILNKAKLTLPDLQETFFVTLKSVLAELNLEWEGEDA